MSTPEHEKVLSLDRARLNAIKPSDLDNISFVGILPESYDRRKNLYHRTLRGMLVASNEAATLQLTNWRGEREGLQALLIDRQMGIAYNVSDYGIVRSSDATLFFKFCQSGTIDCVEVGKDYIMPFALPAE